MSVKNGKRENNQILLRREQYRDQYWQKRDPIVTNRLLWRAQTFRHLVHLLPGKTILELGCGTGLFTEQLYKVTRGENRITATTFRDDVAGPKEQGSTVEFIHISDLPGQLKGKTFDYIIAMDILDKSNCSWILQNIYELLAPGGQVVFYESNPWNVMLRMNRFVYKLFGNPDQRQLVNRSQLYELFSQLGFIKVFAIFNDFIYAPLTPRGAWLLRNLSILLENIPFVRTLAGCILLHAQKPPKNLPLQAISLCTHEQLKGKVSIVVPCHNEEMNVVPLVTALMKIYGEYIYEIVLVDDNSTDNTREVISKLTETYNVIKPVFRRPPNGVGRAISDGFKAATGEYILSMDCDFQHLLPEIRDLFDAAAKGYDVAIGSRFSRHSVLLNYPYQKIIANRAFHLLARMLFGGNFRDLTNNLKLMRREVVEKLELTQPGFAVNAETGFQPMLQGFRVTEVPISWINRTPDMGLSSFKLVKVGGGYWKVLIRLWLQQIRTRKKSFHTLALRKGITSKN